MPTLAQRLSDPYLQGRVKPITLQRYRSALLAFTTWATSQKLLPVIADDWDDALLDYRYSTDTLTKSKFAMVVAALEFFLPQLHGRLPWCRAVLTGWGRKGFTRHTVPLTRRPAYLVAVNLTLSGRPRLAAGLLLQVLKGLRPSEMLNIMADHILCPEDAGQDPRLGPIVIALGAKTNTKSKRPQTITIAPAEVYLSALIRKVRSLTPDGYYLFPHTLAEYRMQLRAMERSLGLNFGLGPPQPPSRLGHRPKVGWSRLCHHPRGRQVAFGRLASLLSRHTFSHECHPSPSAQRIGTTSGGGRAHVALVLWLVLAVGVATVTAPPLGSYKDIEGNWNLPGGRQATPRGLQRTGSDPQASGVLGPSADLPPGVSLTITTPTAPPARAGGRAPKPWYQKLWSLGSRRWSCTGPISLVIAIAIGYHGISGSVVNTVAESLATVTRDVSSLASNTINATIAVTDLALAVSRGGASTLAEAWQGIDVVDAAVEIHGARWVQHRSIVTQDFLESPAGKLLAPLGPSEASQLSVAIAAITPEVPELRTGAYFFHSNNSFVEFSFHVVLLPKNFIGVQVLSSNVSFRVQWANPMWDLWGLNPTQELGNIQARLQQALKNVPQTQWLAQGFEKAKVPSHLTFRGSIFQEVFWRARMWWRGALAE